VQRVLQYSDGDKEIPMKMIKAAVAATLALAAGACQQLQQSTPQQLNQTNANSRIYIGSLTCNVGGSTGYVLASRKSLDCVFLAKDGVQSAQYTGSIDKVGVDIGYTKAVHTIWRVYSLGSDRGPSNLERHLCRRAGHGGSRQPGRRQLDLWRPQRRGRHAGLRRHSRRRLQPRARHRRDDDQAQAVTSPLMRSPAARRSRRR
jgi:hypothetical protein